MNIKNNKMDSDEYGEIINGINTYITIANKLTKGKDVMIGWTDEKYSHYDIIFNYGVDMYGTNIQRGLQPNYLYVSIIGIGAMGFRTDTEKYEDYIQEKFNIIYEKTIDCIKLTELINGIIKELKK